jgi:precorrin-2 dehydrogenase/sirohydrochlorin ferrochelatase
MPVTLVSPILRTETKDFIQNKNIVIATSDNPKVNDRVNKLCRKKHILVDVADNPPRYNFYMGGHRYQRKA